jgi:FkbM family methyltransferase
MRQTSGGADKPPTLAAVTDPESGPEFAAPIPSAWRLRVVWVVARLPGPARRAFWRAARAARRARRRRLEARGDWSLSRPALYGMDARLERHLPPRSGFFVEAGANDGYEQSNTYSLERIHGWRGVLVEPVPELARAAERERDASQVFNCALTEVERPGATVRLLYGGLMTVVAGGRADDSDWVAQAHALPQEEQQHEFDVPARTLSSVLDEAGVPEIDLLSLDVEGYEPTVLRGLDFDRHSPRLLLVEARGEVARLAVEEVLGRRYRLLEELSPFDLLYGRKDVASA